MEIIANTPTGTVLYSFTPRVHFRWRENQYLPDHAYCVRDGDSFKPLDILVKALSETDLVEIKDGG